MIHNGASTSCIVVICLIYREKTNHILWYKLMKLNDKLIRSAFIEWLYKRRPAPKKIIEELSVDNGNAIADIVVLSRDLHCFEIKGESDKIERLQKQSLHYDLAFRKITLITTQNHLDKSFNLAPSYWGIIEAKIKDGAVIFSYKRKASLSPMFSKVTALQTLWKVEMLNIVNKKSIINVKKNHTREKISVEIAISSSKKELSNLIAEQLIDRISS